MAALSSQKILTTVEDTWKWGSFGQGCYSVHLAFRSLCQGPSISNPLILPPKLLWRKEFPKKLCCFLWRWCLNKLPTRENLFQRHILHEEADRLCVFCKAEVEDLSHVMLCCPWSWEIWGRLLNWWGIYVTLPNSIEAMVQQVVLGFGNTVGGAEWRLVCFALCYTIWNARNQVAFENKNPHPGACFDKIRLLSFNWLKYRMGKDSFSFHGWVADPLAEVQRCD
ncbi:hypothetical protein Ancab_040451 [Ancistrocladus abbreviatus]